MLKLARLAFAFGLIALSAIPVSSKTSTPNQNAGIIGDLQKCRSIAFAEMRLSCFDRLAKNNAPPTFEGKLGFRTKSFSLDRPHRVRFRSQGVIFVLYVLTENGDVLQNLHIGGGGEDSYLIENPGRYSLQIDGSARWQIWIEPV